MLYPEGRVTIASGSSSDFFTLGRLVLPGILGWGGDFMQILLVEDLIYEGTGQFVLIWGGYFVKVIREPCIN